MKLTQHKLDYTIFLDTLYQNQLHMSIKGSSENWMLAPAFPTRWAAGAPMDQPVTKLTDCCYFKTPESVRLNASQACLLTLKML